MDATEAEEEKSESMRVLVRCCDVERTTYTAGNTVARVQAQGKTAEQKRGNLS